MKKYVIMTIGFILVSVVLTGCIPQNENVGKPAPHNYKDSYYNDGYYDRGYYGGGGYYR